MHDNTNSGPTIFFVEEDNDVRRSLTKTLRELGYRLLVSADLQDALMDERDQPYPRRPGFSQIF